MAVKIGHASIDERGKVNGGKAGDQTGKEVCIREWYNKPWNVYLVCTDVTMAKKAADYMTAICNDPDFGYDQYERLTGYNEIVKNNGDVSKAKPSEFDCSSLIASCYKLAGLNVSPSLTTRNIRTEFMKTGKFECYTDSAHLTTDAYATIGGVYLNEAHHVVMSLEKGPKATSSSATTSTTSTTTSSNNTEKTIWDFFKKNGMTDMATAGIMGNLYAESGLIPNNLQNTGNTKLKMTDAEYTAAVDNGTYTNFVKDSQGYGLAQWTYYTRKEALLKYAKSKNKSIGDITTQLEFLYAELDKLKNDLNNAKSVYEASNIILLKYEKPADQSNIVQNKRASYGQNYYNKYAGKIPTIHSTTSNNNVPTYTVGKTYTLQTELKVRTDAGTSATAKTHSQLTADGQKHDVDKDGALDAGTRVTCQNVKKVGNDIWIKTPSGWMAAYYQNNIYIK